MAIFEQAHRLLPVEELGRSCQANDIGDNVFIVRTTSAVNSDGPAPRKPFDWIFLSEENHRLEKVSAKTGGSLWLKLTL